MSNLNVIPPGNPQPGNSAYRPSASLLVFLEDELKKVDEFYKNLATEYHESVYKEFEDRFIELRNGFKGKSQDISNPDYEFINRAELRKKSVDQIITCAGKVAERFQEARENKRLHRSNCTDALENLIYAIKNFRHLIKEQGKI